jgi:FKBP-type peptidyl-prolyl cis-trans isomerase FkpA
LENVNFSKDSSYAIGLDFATGIKNAGIVPDLDEILKAMQDVFNGNDLRFELNEAYEMVDAEYATLREKKDNEVLESGTKFLEENGKKPNILTTSSGLQYEVITEGNGAKPSESDVVRVHYEGKLIDGTVFDSSYQKGQPIEFALNGVIPGWTEGLQLMPVGSTYMLYIPSDLGYGTYGQQNIPPNSVLIFKVELIDIVSK